MAEDEKPMITTASVGKILLGIVVFFLVVPRLFGFIDRVNPPEFSIPIDRTAPRDALRYWEPQTDRLIADLTRFWDGQFAEAGLPFEAPLVVSPFEGPVSACDSDVASEDWLYCVDTGVVEIRRIVFNAISRQSINGEHDQEIAYAVAHIYAHHLQALLGVSLLTGDARERLEIELQADCLAGLWLAQGTGSYGRVDQNALRDDIGGSPIAPRFNQPGVPRALIENLHLGDPAVRYDALRAGLAAETLWDCGLVSG